MQSKYSTPHIPCWACPVKIWDPPIHLRTRNFLKPFLSPKSKFCICNHSRVPALLDPSYILTVEKYLKVNQERNEGATQGHRAFPAQSYSGHVSTKQPCTNALSNATQIFSKAPGPGTVVDKRQTVPVLLDSEGDKCTEQKRSKNARIPLNWQN